MANHLSLNSHFRLIAGTVSPKPLHSGLFRHPATLPGGSSSNLADEVRRIATELHQQGQVVGELASAVAGSPAAIAKTATSLLGGSVLGKLASSATGGFSWQSLLKDVLPFGGLVSEIAGLFSSPHVPAPLQQYDAPGRMGFSGVLGSDGNISQASSGQSGLTRASSQGLDLTDAAGGPQPAYSRRTDGALGAIAGAPASRYSGVLDLSSTVRGLITPAVATTSEQSASLRKNPEPATSATTAPDASGSGPSTPVPTFDSTWFMDHAPYIAAAVRSAMLDSHPILDVINDL